MTDIESPISGSPSLYWALLFFVTGIFLSICAVDLYLGAIPLRALCIIASLAIVIGFSPHSLKQVLVDQIWLLSIITVCALIGLIVSILNQAKTGAILVQLVEIHLQAMIGLILAAFFVRALGIRNMILIFMSVWTITAIFALGQAAGMDFAWQSRAVIGDWMHDPAITRSFYDEQKRVVGLSFTPVHLATQTCLAFATFVALRVYNTSGKAMQEIDFTLLGGWTLAILICALSGNRSPLIGLFGFLTIYLWLVAPRVRMLFFPLLIMLLLMLPYMQEMARELGLRIGNTEDGSAVGRTTLWSFGLFLFTEHPIGYGLIFDSTTYAERFAHHAIHMDNPDIIRHFSLHNYYLLMLNKYGFMIIFIIPWILPRSSAQLVGWLAFVPYLTHIAFHNDGPLNSDFLIWFLLPVFSALCRTQASKKTEQQQFLQHTQEAPQ